MLTRLIHVKICGITNLDDARAAVDAGADMLGFILYPKSPRYIQPNEIASIISALRMAGEERAAFLCAGVFVNAARAEIETTLAQTGLDLAQLHGDEPPALVTALAGRAYKALRPATAVQAREEARLYRRSDPGGGPRLLVDAYDPSEYGGTGKQTDWHVAAALAQLHPGLLLAGGLTPHNVADAVRLVRPWGVDVASGVERAPGLKDQADVRAFIANARAAAASAGPRPGAKQ